MNSNTKVTNLQLNMRKMLLIINFWVQTISVPFAVDLPACPSFSSSQSHVGERQTWLLAELATT
jgi:hypothetical protein